MKMLDVLEDIGDLIEGIFFSMFGKGQITEPVLPESNEAVCLSSDPYLRLSPSGLIDSRHFKTDGERYAVLASSRQGKSFVAGKLLEQMLEKSRTVFIFDPQGEYWTLQNKYDILILGGVQNKKEKRLPLDLDSAIEAMNASLISGQSIIFDFSLCLVEEKCSHFAALGMHLFQSMNALPLSERYRIMAVVEEAAIFAPQEKTPYAKESLRVAILLATMGGKLGIDSLFSTQRLSLVDKTIFSQVTIFLFGRVISPQDYKAVSQYITQYGLGEKDITELEQFYFWLCHYDPKSKKNTAKKIKAENRTCDNGGATPSEYKKRK